METSVAKVAAAPGQHYQYQPKYVSHRAQDILFHAKDITKATLVIDVGTKSTSFWIPRATTERFCFSVLRFLVSFF